MLALQDTPRKTFLNVGERCNVAGSIMYKKAIVDGDYDKAHAIALKQVRSPSPVCFAYPSVPVRGSVLLL